MNKAILFAVVFFAADAAWVQQLSTAAPSGSTEAMDKGGTGINSVPTKGTLALKTIHLDGDSIDLSALVGTSPSSNPFQKEYDNAKPEFAINGKTLTSKTQYKELDEEFPVKTRVIISNDNKYAAKVEWIKVEGDSIDSIGRLSLYALTNNIGTKLYEVTLSDDEELGFPRYFGGADILLEGYVLTGSVCHHGSNNTIEIFNRSGQRTLVVAAPKNKTIGLRISPNLDYIVYDLINIGDGYKSEMYEYDIIKKTTLNIYGGDMAGISAFSHDGASYLIMHGKKTDEVTHGGNPIYKSTIHMVRRGKGELFKHDFKYEHNLNIEFSNSSKYLLVTHDANVERKNTRVVKSTRKYLIINAGDGETLTEGVFNAGEFEKFKTEKK